MALCEERARREYALSLEFIAELEARGVAAEVGYSGLAQLLRDVLRISPAEARRRVTHAAAVSEQPLVSGGTVPAALPATAAALGEGALGAEHVEVITRFTRELPSHVRAADREAAEESMVEAARMVDSRALARIADRIRTVLDRDGAPPDDREPAEPVNELHLLTRRNGRLAVRGEFAPESSALIAAVISPLSKPRPADDSGPDPRSAAERQGDALVEALHFVADEGRLPSEGGEKPHIMVTVALDTLRIGNTPPAGHDRAVLDGVGPIDAESARRIACDARIIPVVLGSRSEPLDLGRASYTVSTALRRALVLRDGGCAFPECDRNHRVCHSHHIRHWADDGPTELGNLVLLCGRHHRLIHHSEWECAISTGHPEFRPPTFVDAARRPRRNLVRAVRETPLPVAA